jgi:uncharacterized protein
MRIPTEAETLALHERHAPTPQALDLVWTHCQIVAAVAAQLLARSASGFGADPAMVRAGCLLHDIGVYRLYDKAGNLDYARYIRHGVLGHELLAGEGYPETLCRFASHHTGVGLTAQDVLRQELPLPPGDYRAGTPEETVVMYADKFHTKTSPPAFLTGAAYAASVARFGPDKETAFAAMRAALGEPDLGPLASVWGHRVIDVP